MSRLALTAAAGATGAIEETDEFFENTVLLLHGDGTNGAQNNTFLDSSTNNFTITRNGNTTQGSFSPFSKPDGGFGNFFDGNGDFLSAASNAAFGFGTGDYTIEAWIYLNAAISRIFVASGSGNQFVFFTNSSRQVVVGRVGVDELVSTGTVPLNTWTHVAASRESGTTKIFINGVSAVTPATVTTDYAQNAIKIGEDGLGSFLNGYISNLRVVKGTAVYTAAFTPPTAPLTNITNTSLLTCQSNRFKDNSTNNFTITRNGDVKVTPFSPYPLTTAYDTAVNGGSGYFDGSGDYLGLTGGSDLAFGTGAFTVEFWVNITVNGVFYDSRPTSTDGVYVTIGASDFPSASGNSVSLVVSGSRRITGTANIKDGSWHHVAVARSGTTTKLFVDGVQTGSDYTDTNNYLNGASRPFIGSQGFTAGTANPTGYIAEIRALKGTALYTTTFTPPTAPLTTIANTELLLNFTNAGIFDNTAFNNLETVADAQIDTSVKKYGTGSMEFDGTGDVLLFPASPQLYFGSGDYTVEMWIYINSFATTAQQVAYSSGSVSGDNLYLSVTATSIIIGNQSAATLTASTTISTSTWYHIAACRSGTTLRIFKDGTQVGTTTDSKTWLSDGVAGVGAYSPNNALAINGYIDDLRITKGIARYTAAFTPPDKALLDIGD